jgi:hypothetical protein
MVLLEGLGKANTGQSSGTGKFRNFNFSGVQLTFYPVGNGGVFPQRQGGQGGRGVVWPLTSNKCQGQENLDLWIYTPTPPYASML